MVLMVMGEDNAFHGMWEYTIQLQRIKHLIHINSSINKNSTSERAYICTITTTAAAETHKHIVAGPFLIVASGWCFNGCLRLSGLCVVEFKFYVFARMVSVFVISVHVNRSVEMVCVLVLFI